MIKDVNISVVIPLYNKEKSIAKTLQTVLNQTISDFEIVVVDDGSKDNSLAMVQGINDERIHVIHKENAGVSSARNVGIKAAKGRYIALLDGDDLWDKDYLAEQIRMIHDFPKAAMWGINFEEVSNGSIVRKLATGLPDEFRGYVENYFGMKGRISDLFCSSSVVIRKEVFECVGFFDERIRYAEDCDMWFRIIATHPVAFYDRYLVFYRFEAENRALKREIRLDSYLPYYIDKYSDVKYKQNKAFYEWINRWSSQHIAYYYFNKPSQRQDAYKASKNLDYTVLPVKYKLFFKSPYFVGNWAYTLDKYIKQHLKR